MHTWHWGEPNHGPAEILTNGEGDGDVPGVTHLDFELSISLQ